MRSPYKGLMPYAEEDAELFFGRDRDCAIITANLFASRLTILFGASGVGKSSVLQAGVAHNLRQKEDIAVVVFSDWHEAPLDNLRQAVQDEIERVLGADLNQVEAVSFKDFLADCASRLDGHLVIILDQFEEYLLYHPEDKGPSSFVTEFARVVNNRDIPVSFLIAIREESLARLDRFKGRIPQLFSNYLRLDHLDEKAARKAIEKPLEKVGWEWEAELVETVIDQVRVGRIGLGEIGRGEIRTEPSEVKARVRVETPFLQIVMTRLWDEEQAHGSRQIHKRTLDDLGGAERIVGDYLDAFMDGLPRKHQAVSAAIFHYLVTPSGTKIAQSAGDLAVYADQDREQIAQVLNTLAGPARLLRTVAAARTGGEPRYEVYHDSLAPAMLDWRRRYYQRQRETRVRRLAIGLGIFLALVSLAVFLLAQFQFSAIAAQVVKNAQEGTAVATRVTAVAQEEATVAAQGTEVAQAEATVAVREEALSLLSDADQSISQGDYDQAIDDCTRAIELVPGLTEAYHKRGIVYTELEEYERAIADFDRAIELDSGYKWAYANKGVALHELGRYDEALAALGQAIQLDPAYIRAYYLRGEIYFAREEYERAIEEYDKAIELDPDYEWAYHGKGSALFRLERYDEALMALDQFIQLEPEFAGAYYLRGEIYFAREEYERAIEEYDKVIELDPKYTWAYAEKGYALYKLGRYDEALTALDQAIELEPELAWAYRHRGLVYYDLEEYERAIEEYDKAIEADPGYQSAYADKGQALRRLGRYDEALAAFDQAIQLDPEDVWAYYARGLIYSEREEYDQAIEEYDKAIELDLEYADVYFDRGFAYKELGEKEKAIADFEEFLKLSKDENLRSQAEQHLKELRG
jgi:tetratricopeptide (TPR) repeat protein